MKRWAKKVRGFVGVPSQDSSTTRRAPVAVGSAEFPFQAAGYLEKRIDLRRAQREHEAAPTDATKRRLKSAQQGHRDARYDLRQAHHGAALETLEAVVDADGGRRLDLVAGSTAENLATASATLAEFATIALSKGIRDPQALGVLFVAVCARQKVEEIQGREWAGTATAEDRKAFVPLMQSSRIDGLSSLQIQQASKGGAAPGDPKGATTMTPDQIVAKVAQYRADQAEQLKRAASNPTAAEHDARDTGSHSSGSIERGDLAEDDGSVEPPTPHAHAAGEAEGSTVPAEAPAPTAPTEPALEKWEILEFRRRFIGAELPTPFFLRLSLARGSAIYADATKPSPEVLKRAAAVAARCAREQAVLERRRSGQEDDDV